jgi:hypothetical protein
MGCVDAYGATYEIERHVKVRAEASPYDPDYEEYFSKRRRGKKCDSRVI